MTLRSRGGFLVQAGKLGALTLLSSILGFARELTIVHRFGAVQATDAYLIALSVPTLLFAFLIGSGLNPTVVPPLAGLFARDRRAAIRWFSEFFSVALLIGLLGSLLIYLFAGSLVCLVAPGLGASSSAPAYTSRLSILFFLMVGAYSIACFHCARQKSSLWGLIAVVQNAVIVAMVLTMWRTGPTILVTATVIGAALAFAVQLVLLFRSGYRQGLVFPGRARQGLQAFGNMLPFALAFGVGGDYGTNQVEILLVRIFASRLEPGTITLLALGNKLMAVPVLLVGSALGLALLPAASVAVAVKDVSRVESILIKALTISLLLTLPAMVFYFDGATEIVHLLFGHRALTPLQVAVLVRILKSYSGAIVGLSLTFILGRMVSALRKNRFLIAFGFVTIAAEASLMPFMASRMGGPGISAAISFGSFVYAALLGILVARSVPHKSLKVLISRAALVCCGALGMHLSVRFLQGLPAMQVVPRHSQFMLEVLAGLVVYSLWIFATRQYLGLKRAVEVDSNQESAASPVEQFQEQW